MKPVKCKLAVLLFLALCFASCNKKKETQTIRQKGFLIRIGPDRWMFYPAIRLDVKDCNLNFVTENLETGIVIPLESLPDTTYSAIAGSMDTLNLSKEIETSEGMIGYLLMSAVELEYQINQKFVGTDSQLKSDFSVQTKDKIIEFVYNQFPINISNISQIFCLESTKVTRLPPECEHNKNDPNDYLFQICQYVRSTNKYSILPNTYRIRSISKDTLNSKNVIKVELSCCGLGDIAYFDEKTKKIIEVQYGAK